VNCAKRYRPHSFAPFQANWAIDNRDVAFRIKGAGTSGAHLESRIGGAAANPHILLAAHLAAGLDGIRRKLEPPAPSLPLADSDAAHLPTSLTAALAALESDAILRTALGEEFIQVFLAVKRHELAKAARADADFGTPAYHDRVSDWEQAEYLVYQ
jgi:glutamine synthetase